MKSSLLLDTAVPSLLAAMDALTLEPDFQIFSKKQLPLCAPYWAPMVLH